jgi:acetate kinase
VSNTPDRPLILTINGGSSSLKFALIAYQAKKAIGALAAVLGGLDVLVFSAGIGENSPEMQASICAGLEFLGIEIDESRNKANVPLMSTDTARASVCVIRTDEEVVIARAVTRMIMVA